MHTQSAARSEPSRYKDGLAAARWETRVYHWRAAEKAHGHHLYRWLQLGGHLVLRRNGGRGHL